jgi:hypothetical protein
MSGGGEHPLMGTHNTFLRVGDALFLEVSNESVYVTAQTLAVPTA